jgi:hypothetical protein
MQLHRSEASVGSLHYFECGRPRDAIRSKVKVVQKHILASVKPP